VKNSDPEHFCMTSKRQLLVDGDAQASNSAEKIDS